MKSRNFASILVLIAALALAFSTACNKDEEASSGTEGAAATTESAEGDESAEGEGATEESETAAQAGTAEETPTPTTAETPPTPPPTETAEQPTTAPPGEGAAASAAMLLGSWVMDGQATVAAMPEAEREMAGAFIGMMNITMTFNPDNTAVMSMSMMGESETQEGRYEVLGAEGSTLNIRMTSEGEPPEEMTLNFPSNDVMQISDGEMALVFNRQ
jgi:hypothetical protein